MTRARCSWIIGILVGGQRKLIIFWWHWTLFRQRSDTSYDRSWPGVQRRRQVWVQTIIDTLWICFKIDLFIWKICAVKFLQTCQNRILKVRQSSVPWGPMGPKMVSLYFSCAQWYIYIIVVVGDGGCCRLMVFVSSFAIFSRSRNSCLLSSSPFLAINHEC